MRISLISALFLLLFSFGTDISAQNEANDEKWAQIDRFKEQGRTESALELLEKLKIDVQASGNGPALIKCHLYQAELYNRKYDEGLQHAIEQFNEALLQMNINEKSIMHSALAELYTWYMQQNRWQLANRKQLSEKGKDIKTWTTRDLLEEVNKHYALSLQNETELQNTPAADFELVWMAEPDHRDFYPSLYDVLGRRAILFYQNSHSSIPKSADQFILNDEKLFADVQEFIDFTLPGKFSEDFDFKTLSIYQKMLRQHWSKKDANFNALVFQDLQRLSFVRSKNVHANGNELYLSALENLFTKYQKHEIAGDILYQQAAYHFSDGGRYNTAETENKYSRKQALTICDQAMQLYPGSYGAKNCEVLRSRILLKHLDVQTENVLLPDQDALALLRYRNLNQVFLKIVRSPIPLKTKNKKLDEYDIHQYLNKPLVRKVRFDLPDSGDHRVHSIEIPIRPLETGHYTFLFSLDSNFATTENLLISRHITVSNLAYFELVEDAGVRYYAVDRSSGKPLKDVQIDVYSQRHDNRHNRRILEHRNTLQSDADGSVYFERQDRAYNMTLLFTNKGDSILMPQMDYIRKFMEHGPAAQRRSEIFLDRKVYRPGQLVYFKGIVMERLGDSIALKKQESMNVQLFDVNNQEISNMQLLTSEYGSYNGVFSLPSTGLPGRYYLFDGIRRMYFQVEEYKRPNFEVLFDPLKGSYVVGSDVKVTGNVKNYNGVVLKNVKGNYRIVRETYWPYYRGDLASLRYPGDHGRTEIANGSVKTNEKGQFNIQFKAIADQKFIGYHSPVSQFKILVEFTDINGEIQSAERFVNVGEKAFVINAYNLESIGPADSIRIETVNHDGQHVDAEVKLEVYVLKIPNQMFRSRLWEIPDMRFFTKKQFMEQFPDVAWSNEGDLAGYALDYRLNDQVISTARTKYFEPLWNKMITPAKLYRFTSTDEFGNEISTEQRVLFKSGTRPTSPSALWVNELDDRINAFQSTSMKYGSSAKEAHIFTNIRSDQRSISQGWEKVKGPSLNELAWMPDKKDHVVMVELFSVYKGRSYSIKKNLSVEHFEHKLDLELEQYRDTLRTGSKEKWKMNISHLGKPMSNAEILVSMYDASLDVFQKNQWSFDLEPTPRLFYQLLHDQNFMSGGGNRYDFYTHEKIKIEPRKFDNLNWFGFTYMGYAQPFRTMAAAETLNDPDAENLRDKSTEKGALLVDGVSVEAPEEKAELRSNFAETAFFYSRLMTDDSGNVEINFTVPEALTRWNFQAFAHNKNLQYGLTRTEVISSKPLMIQANVPRFLRAGDHWNLSAKIINASGQDLNVKVLCSIKSVVTGKELKKIESTPQSLEVGEQIPWSMDMDLAQNADMLEVTLQVLSDEHSDGERHVVPVLENAEFVTDRYPVSLRAGQSKDINIENLKEGNENDKLTVEVTANPSWEVVKTIPYLADQKSRSTDDIFNRFYANSLANFIIGSHPEIESVFKAWQASETDLLSELEKNQDLKALIIEETPWLLEAKTETSNHQLIGSFFNRNNIEEELKSSLYELTKLQLGNGAWPWFAGMREDRQVTQNILASLGKLMSIDSALVDDNKISNCIERAIRYMDEKMLEDYRKRHIAEENGKLVVPPSISRIHIQYLYARSYFSHIPLSNAQTKARAYFMKEAEQSWLKLSLYSKGMLAIVFHREGNSEMSARIMTSLKENALHDDEMGFYWKRESSYSWYTNTISRQSMLIQAFSEIGGEEQNIEEMKIWLLKNKQTHMWNSGRATADACFALLNTGQNLLTAKSDVKVKYNDQSVEMGVESAGSLSSQKSWDGASIQTEMKRISFSNDGESIAWAGVYYSRKEKMDEVNAHGSSIEIEKSYFLKTMTETGPEYQSLNKSRFVQVGDIVLVRMTVKIDRDMQYMHLRDYRASGFEYSDRKSGYQYGPLPAYVALGDMYRDYFIQNIDRNTHVIEYEMKAERSGTFSSGYAEIINYYAPEFGARSKGKRISILSND